MNYSRVKYDLWDLDLNLVLGVIVNFSFSVQWVCIIEVLVSWCLCFVLDNLFTNYTDSLLFNVKGVA